MSLSFVMMRVSCSPFPIVASLLLMPCLACGHAATAHRPETTTASPSSSMDLAALQQLGYASYTEIEDASRPTGAITHNADAIQPGVNLFSIHKLCSARLIDNQGNILHEWSRPGEVWGHADLQPNGSILVPTVEDKQSFLLKLDWRNRLVWRLPIAAHHDVEVLPDGRISTLTFRWRNIPAISTRADVRDEQIVLLSAAGKKLQEYSLVDLLSAVPEWTFLDVEAAQVKGQRPRIDLLHANSVVWMRPGWEQRNPLFAESNVLISLRHQNRVLILNPASGKLLWSWGSGELLGQHDATVLDNGHILIFDNGLGRNWSRAVEVDPRTKKIVWQWKAPEPNSFFTLARGAAQRLENGNTLLLDSDHGHALEVMPEGKVVWEYFQPGSNNQVAALVRMKRYPRAYLGSLLD